jgi:hypothetical protein
MKKTIVDVTVGIALSMIVAGTAFAATNPQGTGQPGAPNETCGQGNATTEPSGFLTGGFAIAGAVYAGSDGTASLQNAQSTNAISQYDVACFQLTSNP